MRPIRLQTRRIRSYDIAWEILQDFHSHRVDDLPVSELPLRQGIIDGEFFEEFFEILYESITLCHGYAPFSMFVDDVLRVALIFQPSMP